MDQFRNDPNEFHPEMKIKRVLQETRIVAICEDKDGTEHEIILDSNIRPIPVPYTEQP